jgi:hypothetical protein
MAVNPLFESINSGDLNHCSDWIWFGSRNFDSHHIHLILDTLSLFRDTLFRVKLARVVTIFIIFLPISIRKLHLDRKNLVLTATGYGLHGPGFEIRRRKIFSSSTYPSRPTVGPTHPSLQWVLELLPAFKYPERGFNDPSPSSAQVKMNRVTPLLQFCASYY